MTRLYIQQNANNTETVHASTITRLYEIALDTQDAYIEGSIRVDSIYDKYYNYLTGRFQNLYITALYIEVWFDDYEFELSIKTFLRSYYTGFNGHITTQICESITHAWLKTDTTNARSAAFWNITQNDNIYTLDYTPFANLEKIERKVIRSATVQVINTGSIPELSNRVVNGSAYVGSIFSSSTSITGDSRSSEDTTPNLQSIICPNVTRVNKQSLADNGARYIYLPKVVYILAYMIRYCPNLLLVYVGGDVQYMHYKMFDGNANEYPSTVNLVINRATPPMVFTNENDADDMTTFSFTLGSFGGNVVSKLNIYVPDSSVNTYKNDVSWSTVASRIMPMSELNSELVRKITSNTGDTLLN